MKNISNYVTNLNFEYAVSYSGLRGEIFQDLEGKNKKEIKRIKKEIESARFMQISKLNKEIKVLEDEINIYNSHIININGGLHKSASKVYRFQKEDNEIKSILEILNTKFEEQMFWMCSPIYRDAIVFYSKEDKIVGILQICFSCSWIKNEKDEDLEVDHKIFPLLKNKLIAIGHPIENE